MVQEGQPTTTHRSIAPFAAAAGVVALGAFFYCTSLAEADVRRVTLFGVVASSLAAAVALAALALGVKKGTTNGLLAGVSVGFLARMIAVAVGLIGSGARGNHALLYVAAFFAIYAASQAAEIAYVWASSRARTGRPGLTESTPK